MDSLIRFFQEGGAFMYPIAVVLVVGIGGIKSQQPLCIQSHIADAA